MITFINHGSHGRFANQLFQLATLHSFAKRYNTQYEIPLWKYSRYFETKFPETTYFDKADISLEEPHYAYAQDYFDQYAEDFKNKTVDILGYFQSEKYFSESNEIKNLFSFKNDYLESIKEKYNHLFSKPTIAVGVRRTDYITQPGYYNLPALYYILALQKLDYKNCNIIFISDDLDWCRFHFGSMENAFFPECDKDIDHFTLGTLVTEGWITANSTFHWWSAYLSNCKRVIQPNHLFYGTLLRKEGNVNFYIKNEKFEIFEHEGKKIDLTDVTFTIPVSYDHEDRKKNLELNISLLQQNFNTNIVVGEQGGNNFEYASQWAKYRNFPFTEFHRTKMLNVMAHEATTPIIANYDCDVAFAPMQLLTAIELIRDREADMVYPYGYLFVRLKKSVHENIFPKYDLEVFKEIKNGEDTVSAPSVGGAVLFDKAAFFEGGGENEQYISYGNEDVERYERFNKLGYKIKRVNGDLYHFDHWIGPNSSKANPFYLKNSELIEKERALTPEQLKEEIQSWPWTKDYTEEYYSEISEGGTRSAKEMFKVLKEMEVYNDGDSVVDFGSGIGQWGVDLEYYTAIDFKIPRNLLLIKKYIDHDLRKPFFFGKWDLAICLEVGEHLEEMYADTLVESISNSSREWILFGAAIPGQGGKNHFNEQYQSYWLEKFRKRGFDLYYKQPRTLILDNRLIDYYYRANVMLLTNQVGLQSPSALDPYLDFIMPYNKR